MTNPMTDRRIAAAADLDRLAFDDRGLVPVIVQDASDGRVLMVAWANREALEMTLSTGQTHFWSRSRGTLWRKGETSGNSQAVVSLHADCDGDTVLARVDPAGPACHTGEPVCFGEGSTPRRSGTLAELWQIVESRDRDRPEGSYTTRLLEEENLRVKKLGEEMAELVAALSRNEDAVVSEAADLVYHLMVALKGAGASWSEVEAELASRRT